MASDSWLAEPSWRCRVGLHHWTPWMDVHDGTEQRTCWRRGCLPLQTRAKVRKPFVGYWERARQGQDAQEIARVVLDAPTDATLARLGLAFEGLATTTESEEITP